MPRETKEVAVRKRQQIDSSNKTMFLFVAGAAFLAGIAIVVSVFLAKQIVFHTKIIAEKQSTISTLDKNLGVIDELKGNVRMLDTNQNLALVKSSEDSSALQVVLDALPDQANADAFGASLKNRLIDTTEGVTLENLSINPATIEQAESTSDGATDDEAVDDANSDSTSNIVTFSLEVRGSLDSIRELLKKFERSIRVIELTSVNVTANESDVTFMAEGAAYYEPAKTIQLSDKVVKL